MKKLWFTTLAVVCLVAGASAQRLEKGSLTAAAASCTSSGPSCAIMTFDPSSNDAGAVGIDISSIPNATAVFEASFDGKAIDDSTKTWRSASVTPVASTTTVTSTTSAGAWRVAVSGMTDFRVRCSVFVAGPVVLTIRSSQKAASIGGGGVSFTSGGTSANVLPKSNGSSGLQDSSITDDGTVISSAEPVRLGNGTLAAPSYSFTGQTNAGMRINGAVELVWNGSTAFAANQLQHLWSSGVIAGWASGDADATSQDTFFLRRGAASFQFGAADAAAPVAQTLSVQQPTATNSNQAAGSTTFTTQNGTGTGLATCSLIVNAPSTNTATGTTVQTSLNRLCTHDVKNLTTGAATTVLSIALPAAASTGGTVDYTIIGTDGTNTCTESGFMEFSAENSAGVFVTNITDSTGTLDSKACTATKTLTISWALSGANPSLLQLTPTLTGITATRFTIAYDVHNHGDAVVTF